MRSGTRVALAIGAGYLLGRRHRLRTALMLGAAAATDKLPQIAGDLLRRGTQTLGSSDGDTNPLSGAGGRLADAGKAAAIAAVTNQLKALTDRLLESAGQPTGVSEAADSDEAEDTGADEDTREKDARDEDTGDEDTGDEDTPDEGAEDRDSDEEEDSEDEAGPDAETDDEASEARGGRRRRDDWDRRDRQPRRGRRPARSREDDSGERSSHEDEQSAEEPRRRPVRASTSDSASPIRRTRRDR